MSETAPLSPAADPSAAQARRFAVRGLIRGAAQAALGTLLPGPNGLRPYVSLVTVATDIAGRPLLLLSTLSDHSRNIAGDDRVSLLFDGTRGYANPQQGPRVSLVGRIERCPEEHARRRFLARHPAAALYAGFADFAIFRVCDERAHWVGGFGRAAWVDGPLSCPPPVVEAFLAGADQVMAELNATCGPILDGIAGHRLKRRGAGWRLVGLDPDGCELRRDKIVARLAFDRPQDDIEAARRTLLCLGSGAN
jgi:hypothetical protein